MMESLYILFGIGISFLFYLLVKGTTTPSSSEQLNQANQKIGELNKSLSKEIDLTVSLQKDLAQIRANFDKLQHQKISADVKLGQKTETLLPFLNDFPYKDDYIVGMYNPIDLVVFKDDEVVFVEVKSGQSQLSAKQKQIRDNIKNGKVRFEVHRVNEKGVSVK